MATIPNLGANVQVLIYVENKRLNRDFKQIKDFSDAPEYYEGADEYLGNGPVEPWQRFKTSKISFSIEESDDGYVSTVLNAIKVAEEAGTRPKIEIVMLTTNNNGTTSKTTYGKVTMRAERSAGGKGEVVMRKITATAGTMSVGT